MARYAVEPSRRGGENSSLLGQVAVKSAPALSVSGGYALETSLAANSRVCSANRNRWRVGSCRGKRGQGSRFEAWRQTYSGSVKVNAEPGWKRRWPRRPPRDTVQDAKNRGVGEFNR